MGHGPSRRFRRLVGARAHLFSAVELAAQAALCRDPQVAALVGVDVPLLEQIIGVAHRASDEVGDRLCAPTRRRASQVEFASICVGNALCWFSWSFDHPQFGDGRAERANKNRPARRIECARNGPLLSP